MVTKSASKLKAIDLKQYPVWEYASDSQHTLPDESFVRPVVDLPVDSLDNRIVGTELTLADGKSVFGMLCNLDAYDHYKTEHFISVSVFGPRGKRFDLARYHDVDIEQNGPEACARFLGKRVEDVFPIKYDISEIALGIPSVLRGVIPIRPRQPLTREELIALAIG